MHILSVENLAKHFVVHQLQRTIIAFEAVSFKLHAGELLLVRGPNGVGKSTLLRCLYRTYLPTFGQATFASAHGAVDLARAADVDIALLRRTEIGHVTQFLRPRPRVSALDLAAEPLVLAGTPWNDARTQAQEWLDTFGLKRDIWAMDPSTFSGGEQQKVNLVRALIAPRRLLLLDEPTASLDAATRAALVARVAELKARGVAMLGVFHHPEDVQSLNDGMIDLHAPHTSAPFDTADEQEEQYVA